MIVIQQEFTNGCVMKENMSKKYLSETLTNPIAIIWCNGDINQRWYSPRQYKFSGNRPIVVEKKRYSCKNLTSEFIDIGKNNEFNLK